ncbi:isopentenyl-diphosphate delta-isomerase, partial [Ancylostoma ceylanicum]
LSLTSFRSQLSKPLIQTYDPVQVGYLAEECIAVDEDDNIVGGVTKGDAHHVDTLALHRAFSLFAFTPDKKLILQKRSAEKITFPLLWANTCCSHPLFIPTELDGARGAVAAAVRKIGHELGVADLRPEECRIMGRFLYKAVMENSSWGEHELDYAVVTSNMSLSRIQPNPSEVCDVRAVDEAELAEWVASGMFWSCDCNQSLQPGRCFRAVLIFAMVPSVPSTTFSVRLVGQYRSNRKASCRHENCKNELILVAIVDLSHVDFLIF